MSTAAADSYSVIAGRKRQAIPDNEKCTLKQIRDGIPAHFFEQDTMKASYYVARDLAQVAATYYVFSTFGVPLYESLGESVFGGAETMGAKLIKFVMWNLYWVIQGLNFTGLWVMAHECGHQAYSPSRTINDAVGIVIHSFLLVPYHSWRISHGNHHKHTNHTELDTVFVPEKVKKTAMREALNESPIVSLGYMLLTFIVGWPLYLICNTTGQKYNRRANHFEPSSPLFRAAEGHFIVKSDIGLLAVLSLGAYLLISGTCTAMDIVCWYFIPYMWNTFWLVYITYLQHSDVRLPHYNAAEWTFVRGALCTVDRDFGFAINWWIHHINDSHIVHHLYSTMPFYNAIEVTRKHLTKTVAKEYCLKDNRSLLAMCWESWRNCRVIHTEDGVCWYKK